ncbi:MFS transporter [Rhodococcoides fascians]|uniref:MFS transporter n=1 Tax=Rhodococcoides fascians TaxID=1828 RepID=UPI00055BA207|nr:MFS transporter [Rhodococcus fascians]
MAINELRTPRSEPGGAATSRRQATRIYFASFIGTTIEFFDFIVYGTAAALVFPTVFFDGVNPAMGIVFSFATLAIGYAARPIGGIIGGHYGDRYGRKHVLVATMSVMGVATFLTGLLPSSTMIGILAPILLIVLRVVQGIAVGGEWGGAVLMSVEHAGSKKRGFSATAVAMGSAFGVFLAYASFAALGSLPDDQFLSFGWRIPFVASILLLSVGLYIRLKVEESPVFLEAKKEEQSDLKQRLPILSLIAEQPGRTVIAILVYAGPFMAQAILTTYLITYATTELGLPRQVLLNAMMISLLGMMALIPVFGSLSDRVGRRTVYVPACLAFGGFSFFTFPLVGTGETWVIIAVFVAGMSLMNSATVGVVGSILSEVFPTRHRYTGASVAYQFAGLIGGGLGPLIAASFIGGGMSTVSISIMIAVFCVISAITCYSLGDTRKNELVDL